MSQDWGFFGSRVGTPLFPDPACEVCSGTGYRFKTSKIYCDCLRPPAPSPHGPVFYAKPVEHMHVVDVVTGKAFKDPEVIEGWHTGELTLCCEREVCGCGENLRLVDGEPLNLPGRTLEPLEHEPGDGGGLEFPGRYGDPR